jgi:hypothetical protein
MNFRISRDFSPGRLVCESARFTSSERRIYG